MESVPIPINVSIGEPRFAPGLHLTAQVGVVCLDVVYGVRHPVGSKAGQGYLQDCPPQGLGTAS